MNKLTLTPEQFNKYWHFIRKIIPVAHRQPTLNAVMKYKHLVDKDTALEVEVKCD